MQNLEYFWALTKAVQGVFNAGKRKLFVSSGLSRHVRENLRQYGCEAVPQAWLFNRLFGSVFVINTALIEHRGAGSLSIN